PADTLHIRLLNRTLQLSEVFIVGFMVARHIIRGQYFSQLSDEPGRPFHVRRTTAADVTSAESHASGRFFHFPEKIPRTPAATCIMEIGHLDDPVAVKGIGNPV